MNRSAAPFPADGFKLPIFDNRRNRGVAFTVGEHLLAVFEIVLGVAVFKGDAEGGVMLAGFLTLWTTGLGVKNDRHVSVSQVEIFAERHFRG